MTYVGCDATTAIIMLILALAFNGAACQTSLQNHQDLAPNYAGSLYGIMNTFGSFPGFIIPPIIGALTNERVCYFSTSKWTFFLCINFNVNRVLYMQIHRWNFNEIFFKLCVKHITESIPKKTLEIFHSAIFYLFRFY